jgi:hypothetical protein
LEPCRSAARLSRLGVSYQTKGWDEFGSDRPPGRDEGASVGVSPAEGDDDAKEEDGGEEDEEEEEEGVT